ncbi:hypothetical protein J4406_02865 [Candidatus Woesearchaeota archaeon]|nr:hypothetical protein [Candidatus Woesearchaeota archaeon]
MKISLNIEKRHLVFFGLFLVLVGSLVVIAVDNPKVFHDYLYTDVIRSHTPEGVVEIDDTLRVTGPFRSIGRAKFDGDICDENKCIDASDLINKMEELGVEVPEEETNIIEETYSGNDAKINYNNNLYFFSVTEENMLQFCLDQGFEEYNIDKIEGDTSACRSDRYYAYYDYNENENKWKIQPCNYGAMGHNAIPTVIAKITCYKEI